MGVCNYSMFCRTSLYVHSSIAIILMGKRELVALLNLSSWCLVMVERLFLAVPRGCLLSVYHIHSELIVKYNIGLKTLLQQGISEPIFYGDLVYKFKRIVGKPNFSDQFKKIVKRYIRFGYNLDIMRQSACLVLNPITVYSYGFLFNCTTVGQASDSMTALTQSFNRWVGA